MFLLLYCLFFQVQVAVLKVSRQSDYVVQRHRRQVASSNGYWFGLLWEIATCLRWISGHYKPVEPGTNLRRLVGRQSSKSPRMMWLAARVFPVPNLSNDEPTLLAPSDHYCGVAWPISFELVGCRLLSIGISGALSACRFEIEEAGDLPDKFLQSIPK